MRFLPILLSSVVFISGVVWAAPGLDTRDVCVAEICGSNFSDAVITDATATTTGKRMTNADRLKRGLPLARPKRLFSGCMYLHVACSRCPSS